MRTSSWVCVAMLALCACGSASGPGSDAGGGGGSTGGGSGGGGGDAPDACGCANPAWLNCEAHGGTDRIVDGLGGQFGVCRFADGSECEEWAFYRGECQPGDCLTWSPPTATSAALCAPVRCSVAPLKAPTDAGDQALCQVPRVSCSGADDVILQSQCHLPPSPAPAGACCDTRPAACAPTDCDCLLREGPWIDFEIAADAGIPWPYSGPKSMCSYRVSCTPGTDGGAPVLSCTPA